MLHQPGDGWLYDSSVDLQGVLITRASGQDLPDFLAASGSSRRSGMVDTGFRGPEPELHRLPTGYHPA